MADEPLLSVSGLTKSFPVGRRRIVAVRDVSLTIAPHETLGIIGESGCGKSTLGRSVLRLVRPDAGVVRYKGVDLLRARPSQMRKLRKELQIIFQDPLVALHPRMTVGRNVEDGYIIHHMGTTNERRAWVRDLLTQVGLEPSLAEAYPHELSGGQQQRVLIARTLALSPTLVVCDEPVSALDVSVQAQILQLLRDIQKSRDIAYLFISHNIAAVEYISQRVAVMYLGEVVETGPTSELLAHPRHPYTRSLIQSIMKMPSSAASRHPLVGLEGEIPSSLDIPTGCPFHPRCPVRVNRCMVEKPEFRVNENDHGVSCHLA